MKPKSRGPEQDDLLRPRLTDMIDMRHELVKLSALIEGQGAGALRVRDQSVGDDDPQGRVCCRHALNAG